MVTHPSSESIRRFATPRIPASEILGAVCIAAVCLTVLLVLFVPLDLTDGPGIVVTTLLATGIVLFMTPGLIGQMRAGGMLGVDVNKAGRKEVAELGGISALFAFSVSLSIVVGFQKLIGNVAEPPFLAAISVFFMASMIGLIDDISDLPQRLKAVAVAFAALPLMLVHLGAATIRFPFDLQWNFPGTWHLFYWLILVPIGVTGAANAMNMSAGYNGLETGQIAIVSAALMAVSQFTGAPDVALLVFGAILGCALGLYYFNRYPAQVFAGDIGTIGLGAALASGVILAHVEFYGLVAIAPAFYEFGAMTYYGLRGMNGQRKLACRNPTIDPDGTLHSPPEAAYYTLAFRLLSFHPMKEKTLVYALLGLYVLSGSAAILLAQL